MTRSALSLLLIAPIALAPWVPGTADAQDVRYVKRQLSVEDWRQSLLPEAKTVGKGRKIQINTPAPGMAPGGATPAAVTAAAPADPAPVQEASVAAEPQPPAAPVGGETIAVPISFGFDSAELLPEWLPTLDTLGQVLRETPDLSLVIEGHSDAVGEAGYNLDLSRRRAAAVGAYLADTYGIAAGRLAIVGKGMSEPLTSDPTDPSNRRVQFRRGG